MATGTFKKNGISADSYTISNAYTEQSPYSFTATKRCLVVAEMHIQANNIGIAKAWVNNLLCYDNYIGSAVNVYGSLCWILESGDTIKIGLQTNANDSKLYVIPLA